MCVREKKRQKWGDEESVCEKRKDKNVVERKRQKCVEKERCVCVCEGKEKTKMG